MSMAYHPATIEAISANTHDSVVLDLRLQDGEPGFDHKSGQHVSLRLRDAGEDFYRSYSLCAPPGDNGLLKLGVRKLPGGRFARWLSDKRPGARLSVGPPQGLFGLRPESLGGASSLFVAAGSGITPIIAMLEDLLDQDGQAQACLLYSNRDGASTMFLERLMDLKNRHMARLALHFFTSRESQATCWRNGRIDAKTLAMLVERGVISLRDFQACYICGPGPMMDGCVEHLAANGIARERIHTERFAAAADAGNGAGLVDSPQGNGREKGRVVARIELTQGGVTRSFDYTSQDGSILQAALRNGIALPFSCTGGVCGTCRGKLTAGEVRMAANYALDEDDVQSGLVLSCQAIPQSPTLSLTLDY